MKNETDALDEAIIVLQEKRAKELNLLKAQLDTTYESLKPINLVKSLINEISSSSEIKGNILNNVIGIGSGFLSRKLFVGGSHHPIKRLFGTLIQYVTTNVISKNADGIKSTGENMLQSYLKHRKESKKEFQDNGNNLPIE